MTMYSFFVPFFQIKDEIDKKTREIPWSKPCSWEILALVDESVFGHGLVVTGSLGWTGPSGEVGVGVRFNVSVDVVGRREVWRVATNVDIFLVLVDADIVDGHVRRQGQLFKVDGREARTHSKIGNDVHRLVGDYSRANARNWVRTETSTTHRPRELVVIDPGDIGIIFCVSRLVLEPIDRVARSGR